MFILAMTVRRLKFQPSFSISLVTSLTFISRREIPFVHETSFQVRAMIRAFHADFVFFFRVVKFFYFSEGFKSNDLRRGVDFKKPAARKIRLYSSAVYLSEVDRR